MRIPFIPIGSNSIVWVEIYNATLSDVFPDSVTSVTASLLDSMGTLVTGSDIALTVTSDPSIYSGSFPSTLALTVNALYTLETVTTTVVSGNTVVSTTREVYPALYDNGKR